MRTLISSLFILFLIMTTGCACEKPTFRDSDTYKLYIENIEEDNRSCQKARNQLYEELQECKEMFVEAMEERNQCRKESLDRVFEK